MEASTPGRAELAPRRRAPRARRRSVRRRRTRRRGRSTGRSTPRGPRRRASGRAAWNPEASTSSSVHAHTVDAGAGGRRGVGRRDRPAEQDLRRPRRSGAATSRRHVRSGACGRTRGGLPRTGRLLARGEVAAGGLRAPVHEVGVARDELLRDVEHLAREQTDAGGDGNQRRASRHELDRVACGVPVEASCRPPGLGDPVEHHVGDELLAGERGLDVAVRLAVAATTVDDLDRQRERAVGTGVGVGLGREQVAVGAHDRPARASRPRRHSRSNQSRSSGSRSSSSKPSNRLRNAGAKLGSVT